MAPLEKQHSHHEVQIGAGIDTSHQLMESMSEDDRITMSFLHVSGFVSKLVGPKPLLPSPKTMFKGKKQAQNKAQEGEMERQIMHNLSGACRPGEVLAMMGPSGSGKTSLLSVLGGRTPKAVRMQGKVLYNDQPLTKAVKRKIGFVLQDDLLYEALTVYETLYFAAMLRLPRTFTTAQKVERINSVIRALGLEKCRNTIIGGFFRRGVSGGERKLLARLPAFHLTRPHMLQRVSVGHELLINPSVLLLDEPTSGLDSTTAMHLVATLRTLAQGGRAVLTTIHQPSSRLYQMLDRLLLLSEGHVFFYGNASLATEWFHKLGYSIQMGINAADFLLDLASGDVSTYKVTGEQAQKHLITCAEKFAENHPNGYTDGTELSEAIVGQDLWNVAHSRRHLSTGAGPDDRPAAFRHPGDAPALAKSSAGTGAEDSDGDSSGPRLDIVIDGVDQPKRGTAPESHSLATGAPGATGAPLDKHRWAAPWASQYKTLLHRAVKTRRFEALSTRDFIQFVVVGVLAGLFWLQAGRKNNTVAGVQNIRGLLFFELMFLSMRALLGALFTFPSEFKLLLKERASGMYRLSAYYLARTSSDLPVDCTIPTVFVLIVYFMGGLKYSAGAFFSNWASVLLAVLTAQSIGLLIGSVVTHPKTGQTIATIVALTCVLVAGFFVLDTPVWIDWLKWLSFIFYAYDLLLKIELRNTTIYNCGDTFSPSNPQNNPACTVIPQSQLKDTLRLQRDPNEWTWEPIALLAWLLAFRLVVYYALRARTKAKIR